MDMERLSKKPVEPKPARQRRNGSSRHKQPVPPTNGQDSTIPIIPPTDESFSDFLIKQAELRAQQIEDEPVQPVQQDWLDLAPEHYGKNPLLFVQESYPWNEYGTPLEGFDGPDTWQEEALLTIQENYCYSEESFWFAIASGRGVGKTAFLSWLIQWFICTRKNPLIVVTASTAIQLSAVTWRELNLWHYMSPLTKDFELLKTQYRHRKHPDTWFARSIPWQANKPEAFQGLHDKEMLIIMDEASIIDPIIWEAVQGNFSRGHGLWVVCSNPMWSTSRFRQCFPGGRFAHRWLCKRVDSRQARMADKEEWQKWIDDYGPDSDEAKKYVYGEFPETEEGQFIPRHIIDRAIKREPIFDPRERCIIGIDLARSFTGDATVILVREGDRILYKQTFRERDGSIIRDRLCEVIDRFSYKKPHIFLDAVAGWGYMAAMLRDRGKNVEEVQSGGTADDTYHYGNKRAEMWSGMKTWLETKGCLDTKEENLLSELAQVHYRYRNDLLYMEAKEDMKARGLTSGDEADALAFTFARQLGPLPRYGYDGPMIADGMDFDPRGPWYQPGDWHNTYRG
jgi:hypothetical protein